MSKGLTSGFSDVFILSCTKASASLNWVKYLGTASFNEYSYRMTVGSDGTIFALGSIQAIGFTHGALDVLVFSVSNGGISNWVDVIGDAINDYGADIVYDSVASRYVIVGQTSSTAYATAGGLDWWLFFLDYKGRN